MQSAIYPDPSGYDDRLFRLLLCEYVRRNFSEEHRREMPDVRVCIATPFHDDESDAFESRSIVVIPSRPLPLPLGSWDRDGEEHRRLLKPTGNRRTAPPSERPLQKTR